MKRTIADSITIKVGHGIMTIPRGMEKIKKQKQDTDNKGPSKEKIKKSDQ